jgi:hypothetical protein
MAISFVKSKRIATGQMSESCGRFPSPRGTRASHGRPSNNPRSKKWVKRCAATFTAGTWCGLAESDKSRDSAAADAAAFCSEI